jgi:TetR/AcrR family transcriptional repressor of lmrAB and yxaGH operons
LGGRSNQFYAIFSINIILIKNKLKIILLFTERLVQLHCNSETNRIRKFLIPQKQQKMPKEKVTPENVDIKLFELFSSFGYDGTSMELLSQGTGLKKASLYHRFPKGKQEMAQHVLKIVEEWITDNIVSVLADKTISPQIRLKKAISSLDALYKGGANNCLLRTLTVGPDANIFREGVTNCFNLITQGFTGIAIELCSNENEAHKRANLINPLLQGALVLSGATGDKIHFKNCLATIPVMLQAN